jgi:capsular polysaccharide biosynthesis protein
MDIARAAFKYRFSVVHPAEVAHKPRKPNVPAVLFGGLFATLLLTFLVAAFADLFGGRFVEPWQVERRLKIPLLGEVSPPLLPKGPDRTS